VNPSRISTASVGKQELERVNVCLVASPQKWSVNRETFEITDQETSGRRAMFGEERRVVVDRSLVVDVILPNLYRITGNKPSAALPMRPRCSGGLAGFHVLLIGWRGDGADH
jgi:hypothetical protein